MIIIFAIKKEVIAGLSKPKWSTNQRSQARKMESNALFMKETAHARCGACGDLK